ncbi:hypothetical protein GLAREA_04304 [Glarea lozoyensis ATCC 20868]|uniref:Uncharacterized protein n=1 Tax=Glarea lozoyensis (strain ATCC 20868 / MF5171) TaxID=1116229 RepID=S3DLV3_GLAL2|nr:uncharacterized protein GLAREA_04304 [Glarea lozoyensis ATCC 20868]EPE27513.1 hypothetical protein GLAREA_04304 [Glarea lozoyensis ATCC 20868]
MKYMFTTHPVSKGPRTSTSISPLPNPTSTGFNNMSSPPSSPSSFRSTTSSIQVNPPSPKHSPVSKFKNFTRPQTATPVTKPNPPSPLAKTTSPPRTKQAPPSLLEPISPQSPISKSKRPLPPPPSAKPNSLSPTKPKWIYTGRFVDRYVPPPSFPPPVLPPEIARYRATQQHKPSPPRQPSFGRRNQILPPQPVLLRRRPSSRAQVAPPKFPPAVVQKIEAGEKVKRNTGLRPSGPSLGTEGLVVGLRRSAPGPPQPNFGFLPLGGDEKENKGDEDGEKGDD